MNEHIVEVIFLICVLLAFVSMARCQSAETREHEQTRRLYIEKGYCEGNFKWAPCK